jgi:glycosyltransferase involved in cell wall biosynthesis
VTHPGYTQRKWGRNLTLHQCLRCDYNAANESSMVIHVQGNHGGPIPMPEIGVPIEDWAISEREKGTLKGVRVALGFLTWNCKDAAIPAAEELVRERDRLRAMGAESEVIWLDNGSTDGTMGEVFPILSWKGNPTPCFEENRGSSVGRNRLIDLARNWDADYLLFIDGDIQVIPYSAYALTVALRSLDKDTAVLGLDSSNCGPEGDVGISPDMRVIHPWMMKRSDLTALTQYGLWDMRVFNDCRFDETGPFGGPGWGLEDDEMWLQFTAKGWKQYTVYPFRYTHRHIHSSVRALGGDFVLRNFEERRKYVLNKWKGTSWAASHLRSIAGLDIRCVVDRAVVDRG